VISAISKSELFVLCVCLDMVIDKYLIEREIIFENTEHVHIFTFSSLKFLL
jgi:hypothetical protein